MRQLPSLLLEGFVGSPYPCHPLILFLIYCLQNQKTAVEVQWNELFLHCEFLAIEIALKIRIQHKCFTLNILAVC
jgi:hypothetical protein